MSEYQALAELVLALVHGQIQGVVYAADASLSFGDLARAAQLRALALKPDLKSGRRVLMASASAEFLIELLACWSAGVLPLVVDAWLASRLQPDWLGSNQPDQQAALVLFTSGSAGEPKGVVLSHQGILTQLKAVASSMKLETPDKVAVLLPLHHGFALITQVLLTLFTGGELHLMPAGALPGERLAYLQAHKIRRLAGVPTHFRSLLDGSLQLPELRHLKVAGAALDLPLAEKILKACPQAELWVGYGLTEAGPRVSALSHHEAPFWQGSAGRPLADVKLKLDPQGQVLIQSPGLMLGYLAAPEQTQAVLSDGWLSSGDNGQLRDGYLYLSGRRDDVFQVAGEKIAPLEIEKILLACPGVQAAAVYGEPDVVLGQRMIALVQGDVTLPVLRRWARAELPSQKRPHSWYAVDQLPLTANGKLKRRELPQWPKQTFTPEF